MSYYIGFLKENKNHAVIFRSIVKPRRDDLTYFIKVIGPYETEAKARTGLKNFRGYMNNPIDNPISREDIKEAVALGKRVYTLYKKVRKRNPGREYHDQHFLRYMIELEKYVLGSPPYIATLAKAYEHLKSAKASEREMSNPVRISESQIRRGTLHELEHTTDRAIARKIACDHLREDPKYYTHLATMERRVRRTD